MYRSGWDARRRNRNIGTAKAGHGQDNRLTIPEPWINNCLFHERLNNPVAFEHAINGHLLTFLVESTYADFCHACTPEDIAQILKLIPASHLEPIKLIVLRQPKRKEVILNPVWGRLQYWTQIEQYSGPAIHLEAQPRHLKFRWRKSLSPDQAVELERLQEDGHHVRSDRRYHYIESTPEAIRHTQLYRTLPHEIGHYVDYLDHVIRPANQNSDTFEELERLYWTKPTHDKEQFAHRYATQFVEHHLNQGNIPFEGSHKTNVLTQENLSPEWFCI